MPIEMSEPVRAVIQVALHDPLFLEDLTKAKTDEAVRVVLENHKISLEDDEIAELRNATEGMWRKMYAVDLLNAYRCLTRTCYHRLPPENVRAMRGSEAPEWDQTG
jgi:hypothetical protein